MFLLSSVQVAVPFMGFASRWTLCVCDCVCVQSHFLVGLLGVLLVGCGWYHCWFGTVLVQILVAVLLLGCGWFGLVMVEVLDSGFASLWMVFCRFLVGECMMVSAGFIGWVLAGFVWQFWWRFWLVCEWFFAGFWVVFCWFQLGFLAGFWLVFAWLLAGF